jgi:2-iminobutanoate/2-iminopropanoate deaminase
MERIQPAAVFNPQGYAQCIRDGDTLYLSGQVAVDRDGELVGRDDVHAQAEHIWRQIGLILHEGGADYGSIVKVTTYLVDMGDREVAMTARKRFLGEHVAASTLVAVAALARPEFLIEVEVIAAAR